MMRPVSYECFLFFPFHGNNAIPFGFDERLPNIWMKK